MSDEDVQEQELVPPLPAGAKFGAGEEQARVKQERAEQEEAQEIKRAAQERVSDLYRRP